LVAAAGLPRITVRGSRYAGAPLMIRGGVPFKVVSERLGHAQVATTPRLSGHVQEGVQREGAARPEAALGAAPRHSLTARRGRREPGP